MKSRSILPRPNPKIMMNSIVKSVCETWEIDPQKVFGASRRQPTAFARQLCMSLMYQLTNMSLIDIGKHFNRHHATVLHAIKIVNKNSNNPDISNLIKQAINKIVK